MALMVVSVDLTLATQYLYDVTNGLLVMTLSQIGAVSPYNLIVCAFKQIPFLLTNCRGFYFHALSNLKVLKTDRKLTSAVLCVIEM